MYRVLVVALIVIGCSSKSDRGALVEAARAVTRDAELSHPRPILSAKSLRDSQAYFRDVLGFKLDWDYGDPANFGSVSRGDAVLFVCEGCSFTPGETMIFACDVEALHEEFKAKGAIIKMPPTDMPWGLREMKVAAPDTTDPLVEVA